VKAVPRGKDCQRGKILPGAKGRRPCGSTDETPVSSRGTQTETRLFSDGSVFRWGFTVSYRRISFQPGMLSADWSPDQAV
jgi:hypothetical protein